MSKPIQRRAPEPDATPDHVLRSVATYAREQTVSRIRDYLGRGRPLAGVPAQTLEAQWIAAYLEVHALDDDSRADELRDLGTEFDLRGLAPPSALVAPELARFDERFGKALRQRRPDPAIVERAVAELDAISDRLIDSQRTV